VRLTNQPSCQCLNANKATTNKYLFTLWRSSYRSWRRQSLLTWWSLLVRASFRTRSLRQGTTSALHNHKTCELCHQYTNTQSWATTTESWDHETCQLCHQYTNTQSWATTTQLWDHETCELCHLHTLNYNTLIIHFNLNILR